MRPPEFTGGNSYDANVFDSGDQASMRPPEFTGGNSYDANVFDSGDQASMRPPEFTGGNIKDPIATHHHRLPRFNEAAGIHRRKPCWSKGV